MTIPSQRWPFHEGNERAQERHEITATGQRKIALGIHKMFDELELRAGQDLSDEEIQVNWRNVLLGIFVHRTDISGAEKFQSRGYVFHVGSRQDRDAFFFRQALDAAQKPRRVFQMFDHFYGRDHIELRSELSIEQGIIEIELDKFGL